MGIEIRNAAIEARLQKQLQKTGSASIEEVLNHMLDTQEEQDRWALEKHDMIRAKIRRGVEDLDRGEGVPEERLNAYLAELKRKTE
jgi:predicted transcriptional regulator